MYSTYIYAITYSDDHSSDAENWVIEDTYAYNTKQTVLQFMYTNSRANVPIYLQP